MACRRYLACRQGPSMERQRLKVSLLKQLKTSAFWIFGCVALLWLVELVNLALDYRLNALGIRPRTLSGLAGIVFAPFLHGGIGHVLTNTIPFVILGWLVILHGPRTFLKVSAIIILLSGIGIWLFGRSAYHIGASGLIFGYFGFLIARAWYERSLGSILVALITIILYGGILWGAFPFHPQIAWEGHLFGLLAGVLAARLVPREAADESESPRSARRLDYHRLDRP
jgi:membrane associated rhomboid family serine protease